MANDLNRNKILFVSWNQQNNMEVKSTKKGVQLKKLF